MSADRSLRSTLQALAGAIALAALLAGCASIEKRPARGEFDAGSKDAAVILGVELDARQPTTQSRWRGLFPAADKTDWRQHAPFQLIWIAYDEATGKPIDRDPVVIIYNHPDSLSPDWIPNYHVRKDDYEFYYPFLVAPGAYVLAAINGPTSGVVYDRDEPDLRKRKAPHFKVRAGAAGYAGNIVAKWSDEDARITEVNNHIDRFDRVQKMMRLQFRNIHVPLERATDTFAPPAEAERSVSTPYTIFIPLPK